MKRSILLGMALLACLGCQAQVYQVTAYCHCAKCCGIAHQPTASGHKPVAGVTVAGPRNIPLGTMVRIEGLGVFKVQDRLANAFDRRFDIFMRGHKAAQQFGLRILNVTILK